MNSILCRVFCYGFWICCLALLANHQNGFAQLSVSPVGQPSQEEGLDLKKIFGEEPLLEAAAEAEPVFEGPVDPREYIVGPGDQLKIFFWKPRFFEYRCTVNAEGDVAIPLVGSFSVANLTLADARQRIESEVGAELRAGRVTVSLYKSRRFRIHVAGMVEEPGTYVVPATARVADAILLAGGIREDVQLIGTDTAGVPMGSERRIELRDGNGERIARADMLMFQRSGLLKANPILRDGMTVYVDYPAQPFNHIGLFGAVNDGGLFEYVADDRVSDLIRLGGGLTSNADSTDLVLISRQGERDTLDLTADLSALERPLFSGDRLYVGGFPDTSRIGSVTIKGEVRRPGGYPIQIGLTTVQEAVEFAGGLLPTAAAQSARLIRRQENDRLRSERERVLYDWSARLPEPALYADPQIAAEFHRWAYGTVVMDLTEALSEENRKEPVYLYDGDVLDIPSTPLGVRVLGWVNHAGEVDWIPDGRLSDYLRRAGGLNRGGWKSQTVVLKAKNGSQIRYESSLPIDPGDIIIVPPKLQITNWERVKDTMAIVAQLATVALIIQNISSE